MDGSEGGVGLGGAVDAEYGWERGGGGFGMGERELRDLRLR